MAEKNLPQDHCYRGGFLVFSGVGLRLTGKVVCHNQHKAALDLETLELKSLHRPFHGGTIDAD